MLHEDIKKIKSEKSDLRNFGITVGIVIGLLGGLFLWREKDSYYYFFIISFALIFFGITVPVLLRPVQKAWMTIAVILGWFMTRVILSILFFLTITPLALLAKLLGKDFLDMKLNRNAGSYWVMKKDVKRDKSSYEKQF